ncbi:hypothetical protein V2J09_010928 [Rumex salicifolius]
MAQLCPKMSDVGRRVVIVRRYFRLLWDRTFVHSGRTASCKPRQYHHIPSRIISSTADSPTCATPPLPFEDAVEEGLNSGPIVIPDLTRDLRDSDLVSMKICLIGDTHIGKTSFLTKYVGNGKEQRSDTDGMSFVDKIQSVQGAHLIFRICEVGGDVDFQNNLAASCKDSVAILFMFDLSRRRTLTSIVRWYQEARKWNQTAIPILIGTKFDEFVQLPMDLQWTIASEARKYAKAINATLFFSSSTYNINVNKVFKFITAKLFNLPWSVERNLTVGEPIIDF